MSNENMNQKNSKIRSLFLVLQKVTGISTNYGLEHIIRDVYNRDWANIWYQVELSNKNAGVHHVTEVTKN